MINRPWFQHYSAWVPRTIDYPQVPLYRFLQESAARFPDRPALIFYDGARKEQLAAKSYGELDDESSRFAAALSSLGVVRGDRVAYFLYNSPALVAGFYGILKAGATAVPCNPMYQSQELSHQLQDSGATAILCDPGLFPLVAQIAKQTDLKRVKVAGPQPENGTYSMEALVESHDPPSEFPAIDPIEDLALLPYTGGTTGVPKGAMLTHYNLVADTLQFKTWFGYRDQGEVFIAALPCSTSGASRE